ncbi:GntR family transcriptional regulator [Paracoccus sp. Z330]|uniref:GntR family transcriptional regulator n=1 Tax=Paracoccus onchidii TaxID=3017813 RepID=A0ABT4ZG03_9RHOB|nr:GntR family transcriptional regulator [Paracoccus onchidii]MDB6178284.1 GntR family transcriptional regulator [Paracoccus onchidii]
MAKTRKTTDEVAGEDRDASIYDRMLKDISTGQLAGGQRLKVAELAKHYGVSTSPIREVLRRMQGEGFVEFSPNRGATVRKADAAAVQNVFEMLQLLEPYFVTWFAEFARPEWIGEMDEIQKEIAVIGTSDLAHFRRLDAAFHETICKYHYNQPAADMWRNLRRALNVYGARLRVTPPRYAQILQEHEQLLQAFCDNDVERAEQVLRQHIDGSYVQMSQQMKAIGF